MSDNVIITRYSSAPLSRWNAYSMMAPVGVNGNVQKVFMVEGQGFFKKTDIRLRIHDCLESIQLSDPDASYEDLEEINGMMFNFLEEFD